MGKDRAKRRRCTANRPGVKWIRGTRKSQTACVDWLGQTLPLFDVDQPFFSLGALALALALALQDGTARQR